MPTTPGLALPYPAPTATPDVPYDMQQLAETLDAVLATTRPRIHAYHTAPPTIASGTSTAAAFNAELFKVGITHDNATNNSRFTFSKAGLYLLNGGTEWTSNATGYRRGQWRLNGTTYLGSGSNMTAVSGTGSDVQATELFQAVVGDYVELMWTQTSTIALGPAAGGYNFFYGKAIWLNP